MRHPHLFIPQIYCRECKHHKKAPEEVRERNPELLWCSRWMDIVRVDGYCHEAVKIAEK